MANQKVRPHNKIIQLLADGKAHTVDSIKAHFDSDDKMNKVMYRLSTFMYDIKKYENGSVAVGKDGRKVVEYRLVNSDDYDVNGFYIEGSKPVRKIKAPVDPVDVVISTLIDADIASARAKRDAEHDAKTDAEINATIDADLAAELAEALEAAEA